MSLETIGFIHSKETFGTVDGPGIRYVLFLQGCPMRCLYCHNPDTWNTYGGTQMSVKEILDDYESYKPFLKDGGITLSGGEALLQMQFVIDLFEACKQRGIHTCLDTSGITFNPKSKNNLAEFDKLMKVTDLVMLDIKHIDDDEHRKLTKHSNKQILAFLSYLNDNGVDTWIRHVIIPGITYKKQALLDLGYELGKYKNIKALDILPYHNMGEKKYEELGIDYALKGMRNMTKEEAINAKKIVLFAMKSAQK